MTLVVAGNINPFSDLSFDHPQRVRFLGPLDHVEVTRLQQRATVLLLMGWPGGYQIPAKLFEYIGARRPILAIRGGPDDPAARLIERMNRGIVVEPEQGAIRRALCTLFDHHRAGSVETTFDLAERPDYSWPNQIAFLARAVERLSGQDRKRLPLD
jgi:hypothetical protein